MTENPSFENALAELETILRALEDGGTTLEESLARYERGVSLLKHCYARLQDAEQRITVLAGLDAEGKPILKPFDHTASDLAANDGKPRSRLPPPPQRNGGRY
jgi:exodeoxyribonuclease VII small subunit